MKISLCPKFTKAMFLSELEHHFEESDAIINRIGERLILQECNFVNYPNAFPVLIRLLQDPSKVLRVVFSECRFKSGQHEEILSAFNPRISNISFEGKQTVVI